MSSPLPPSRLATTGIGSVQEASTTCNIPQLGTMHGAKYGQRPRRKGISRKKLSYARLLDDSVASSSVRSSRTGNSENMIGSPEEHAASKHAGPKRGKYREVLDKFAAAADIASPSLSKSVQSPDKVGAIGDRRISAGGASSFSDIESALLKKLGPSPGIRKPLSPLPSNSASRAGRSSRRDSQLSEIPEKRRVRFAAGDDIEQTSHFRKTSPATHAVDNAQKRLMRKVLRASKPSARARRSALASFTQPNDADGENASQEQPLEDNQPIARPSPDHHTSDEAVREVRKTSSRSDARVVWPASNSSEQAAEQYQEAAREYAPVTQLSSPREISGAIRSPVGVDAECDPAFAGEVDESNGAAHDIGGARQTIGADSNVVDKAPELDISTSIKYVTETAAHEIPAEEAATRTQGGGADRRQQSKVLQPTSSKLLAPEGPSSPEIIMLDAYKAMPQVIEAEREDQPVAQAASPEAEAASSPSSSSSSSSSSSWSSYTTVGGQELQPKPGPWQSFADTDEIVPGVTMADIERAALANKHGKLGRRSAGVSLAPGSLLMLDTSRVQARPLPVGAMPREIREILSQQLKFQNKIDRLPLVGHSKQLTRSLKRRRRVRDKVLAKVIEKVPMPEWDEKHGEGTKADKIAAVKEILRRREVCKARYELLAKDLKVVLGRKRRR